MPFWIGVLIAAALLALALLCRASVVIHLSDSGGRITAHYLFFRFGIHPGKAQKGLERGVETVESAVQKEKPPVKKRTAGEFLELVRAIARSLNVIKSDLLRKLKVRDVDLSVAVGGIEPAGAAIVTGAISAAAYTALGLLSASTDSALPQVDIRPDYGAKETRFSLHLKVSAPVWALLIVAVKMVRHLAGALRAERKAEEAKA